MTDFGNELAKETAKAAGQVVVDTAADSRKAVAVVFGDAAREVGMMLGDHIRRYRFDNWMKIIDHAQEEVTKRGLTAEQIKTLPFGDTLRIVEACSMEEETDVQSLWARLIANSVDPGSGVEIKKVYLELLGSISPVEAALLDFLFRFRKEQFASPEELKAYNEAAQAAVAEKWGKFDSNARRTAIHNLLRLRCIAPRPHMSDGEFLGRAPRNLVDDPFREWSFVDSRKFAPFLESLMEQVAVANGSKDHTPTKGVPLVLTGGGWGSGFGQNPTVNPPELNFVLTSLGRELMGACQTRPVTAVMT